MGKEKEMLRAILSNTEAIMKHLKIEASENKETKKEMKPEIKISTEKKLPAKKSKSQKK